MYMHVYNITHIIYMDQGIYMEDRLKSFILLWHFARKANASMMVGYKAWIAIIVSNTFI